MKSHFGRVRTRFRCENRLFSQPVKNISGGFIVSSVNFFCVWLKRNSACTIRKRDLKYIRISLDTIIQLVLGGYNNIIYINSFLTLSLGSSQIINKTSSISPSQGRSKRNTTKSYRVNVSADTGALCRTVKFINKISWFTWNSYQYPHIQERNCTIVI